jgi:hypothetical protein
MDDARMPEDEHDEPLTPQALADAALLESLLVHVHRPHKAEHEQRVGRVMAALREEAEPAIATRAASTVSRSRFFMFQAIAAIVLIGFLITWPLMQAPPTAEAAMEQAIRYAAEPVARSYDVEFTLGAQGEPAVKITARAWVRGANEFVLKFRGPFGIRDVAVGANAKSSWFVSPTGDVIEHDDPRVWHRLSQRPEATTPLLHIATALERMATDYDITLKTGQPLPNQPDQAARFYKLIGQRKSTGNARYPDAIEIWTEPESGRVEEIHLLWNEPGRAGLQGVTIRSTGTPNLPDDWFRASAHTGNE